MACGRCRKRVSAEVARHVAKLKAGKPTPPKIVGSTLVFSALEDVKPMEGFEQDPENELQLNNIMPECCSRSMLHLTGEGYQVMHFCKGSCEHKNKQTFLGTCKDCQ